MELHVVEMTGLDGATERRILTAVVVSTPVLMAVLAKWDGKLFASRFSNIAAQLCMDYGEKRGRAPGRDIEGCFEEWILEHKDDKSTIKCMEKYLSDLSSDYERLEEEINPDYVIDLAVNHFNSVRYSRLCESISTHVNMGNLDKADAAYAAFSRIELGGTSCVKVCQEPDEVEEVFSVGEEPLVRMPGALREFYGTELGRDCFVALMGPEKSGKSFDLLNIVHHAVCQGNRVALFEVGDMSKRQVCRRVYSRVSQHPWKSTRGDEGWPCTIKIPTYMTPPNKREPAHVDWRTVKFDKPLNADITWKACVALLKGMGMSKDPLRLVCRPAGTINVQGVRSMLLDWDRNGWSVDVLVIDYADILLLSGSGRLDKRDQVNQTWEDLRALSSELHCLVVTATQTDADSYDKYILSRTNFSEDKRKYAHVTGLVGINVTAAEKEVQVRRYNWIQRREAEFSSSKVVHAAGCLPIADPTVISCFG